LHEKNLRIRVNFVIITVVKPAPVLYPKQKRILSFIQTYIDDHGHGPALHDIAQGVGLKAVSTVHAHLKRLERKGVLRRSSEKGYQLLREAVVNSLEAATAAAASAVRIPLVGVNSAGLPIEAIEERSETVDIDPSLMGRQETYALRVRGESMQDHHICDGDIVIVEKQDSAHNGETVVALLEDGTVTLKDFYREKNGFRLQARNPAYAPLIVQKLQIQGKVIGLIRRY
jgi:repressor LexA